MGARGRRKKTFLFRRKMRELRFRPPLTPPLAIESSHCNNPSPLFPFDRFEEERLHPGQNPTASGRFSRTDHSAWELHQRIRLSEFQPPDAVATRTVLSASAKCLQKSSLGSLAHLVLHCCLDDFSSSERKPHEHRMKFLGGSSTMNWLIPGGRVGRRGQTTGSHLQRGNR